MQTGAVAVSLRLLDEVRWRDAPVPGERAQALLAALALAGGRATPPERLIELVWGDEAPNNGLKGLQVLVSRTRNVCGTDAILRDEVGYRLGVGINEVDALLLRQLVREAEAALPADGARAAELAQAALGLVAGGVEGGGAGNGHSGAGSLDNGGRILRTIREDAHADLARARAVHARALSRTGAHVAALPGLEAARLAQPDDEPLLADLLRSEAAERGPSAALDRYERFRRDLRERLGTSPGEELQRLQRDLLALEEPVRSGVQYEANALLGRDGDLARLRALLVDARVVSIVGPGGLGKTRLAHVLARESAVPVVHFVELVGVTAPEDLVGEVGSVLGVRDSVASRRAFTPEQRADLRGRIAQRLGQASSLLVLDNCEHLVGAVAELVAFLVTTTAELRVLTTSRAPLAIGAERVYRLGALEAADGVELFTQRAVAARPGVALLEAAVTSIVARLDGLPLAIELAAAKVRVMAVEDIDRRLENRFALLRGGDRSAPDRHQTLLAVIDWSWNLLAAPERRALRRLALFHDGFTLAAADAVLGDTALDAVLGLVDQSLLSVEETPLGVRYRMLETVREFGRLRLVDAGEDHEAALAQRRWAVAFALEHGARLWGLEQFDAIDVLSAEEANLADELRAAITAEDRGAVIQLLEALASFWAVRGEHGRLLVLTDAISAAVDGWYPPPELEDATRAALTVMLSSGVIAATSFRSPMHMLLHRLGSGATSDPRLSGMVKVMLAYDPEEPGEFMPRMERLSQDPDPYTARAAAQWLAHVRENTGDHAGALEAAQAALALVEVEDGPWLEAILRYQLAQLFMQQGDRRQATEHAQAALVVMQRLGADDDEVQLHALIALCAISEGRLSEAEQELEQINSLDVEQSIFGGFAFRKIGYAELALARGDVDVGLALYCEAATAMREMKIPGLEHVGAGPWTLAGDAAALVAHAFHGDRDEDKAHGAVLYGLCRGDLLRALDGDGARLDIPATGLPLFALAAWGLQREAIPSDAAVKLLALAGAFSFTRMVPTMDWDRLAPLAQAREPGLLAALEAEYGALEPSELLDQARDLAEQLPE